MALASLLVFRARLRLLPLVVALAAAALTFGALALVGAVLTMASIAVLPVLIGLAVDYAIQLQARVEEQRAATGDTRRGVAAVATRAAGAPDGRDRRARDRGRLPRARCSRRCRWSAASACCSSVGIVIAFACALTLGTAALAARRDARRRAARGRGCRGRRRRDGSPRRGAAPASCWPTAASRARSARAAARSPARWRCGRPPRRGACSRSALALAVARLGRRHADAGRVRRPRARARRPAGAARPRRRCRTRPASCGEIDVLVAGRRPRRPEVVRWMTGLPAAAAQALRLQRGKRGCGKAELCPAFSLPDLFAGAASAKTSQARSTRCSTRSRRTSPRASSRATARRRRSRSASG